jgi:DTW domain-containing protein
MKPKLCLCAHLHQRRITNHVTVFAHDNELRKTTNTGRLLPLLLSSSDIVRYGGNIKPSWPLPQVMPGRKPLVLFPREGAPTVAEAAQGLPVQLFVLDGTWHQAAHLRQHVATFDWTFVQLPPNQRPSIYPFRHSHLAKSLSTIEAAARALSTIEPDGDLVEEHILDGFRRMTDRLLWMRGDLRTHEVHGGIPAGLQRHAVDGPVDNATPSPRLS